MPLSPEDRLRELGHTLPPPPAPIGTYVGAVLTTGNLLFLSGKGPDLPGAPARRGKVGADISIDDSQKTNSMKELPVQFDDHFDFYRNPAG